MLFIFYTLVLTSFIQVECRKKEQSSESEDHDLGNQLADTLKNDANLDLPVDDEYEDLRAEFLAYRTALASLASPDALDDTDDTDPPEAKRRSMLSTPCWQRSGICINHRLCKGFPSLSQIPGCKDKLRVCCFVWAKYNVRDHKEFGLGNLQLPWSLQTEFGGLGVVDKNVTTTKRPRNRDKKAKRSKSLAYIIRTQ